MSKERLYLIKLGGSLITDKSKPYSARIDVIKRLAKEIKNSLKKGMKIILGHGGGSFPHVSASKYQTYKGFIDKDSKYGMSVVHYDAAKLNMIVVEEFLNAGLKIFPLQTSSIAIAKRSKIIDMYVKPIEKLLEFNIIPVLYGDVGIDLEQGCCILSTEEIFRYLAVSLRKYYEPFIVMCGIVDGLYDKDPLKYPDAKFIEIVNKDNINIVRGYLSSSYWIDVTGGMKHKIETLYKLTEYGINSILINCLKDGNLEKFLKGYKVKGTFIK